MVSSVSEKKSATRWKKTQDTDSISRRSDVPLAKQIRLLRDRETVVIISALHQIGHIADSVFT